MSTLTQNPNSPENHNQTALILEHVELLLHLYEEYGEKHTGDFDRMLNAKATEIASAVENQIVERFENLESKILELNQSITTQTASWKAWKDAAEPSSDALVEREEYQRELELKLDQVTERFTERTTTVTDLVKIQIEHLLESLDSKLAQFSQDSGSQVAELGTPVFNPAIDSNASHWHKQKEAMLSKYGIDPDYRPLMELPQALEQESEPKSEHVEAKLAEPSLSMSESDAAAIEELKERLNEKLRDAEVELSISRAKISQKQAELAETQVELDRRAAAIEQKYAAVAQTPKRRIGFFAWLWHHLKPKPPKANDRA